jgi:hypothetical protein
MISDFSVSGLSLYIAYLVILLPLVTKLTARIL